MCLGSAELFNICFQLRLGSLTKSKLANLVKKVNKCIFALLIILIYLKSMFTKESGIVVEKTMLLEKVLEKKMFYFQSMQENTVWAFGQLRKCFYIICAS